MYAMGRGIGGIAPPGLSQDIWLTYHPEFTSKVVGYTASGQPIYQGVSADVELAKVNAWAAYTGAVYNPSNLLATNVNPNVPAFAGALVLPTVQAPPKSVPADTHSTGTQQVGPLVQNQTQSTNASSQTQTTVGQAAGDSSTTAVDTGSGLSALEIMIGVIGIGIAIIGMSSGKGKR